MKIKFVQSLFLFFAALSVLFYGRFQRDEAPLNVVSEMIANCKFNKPGPYRQGPYPKSIKWCPNVDKQDLIQLMNHIKVNINEMDASIAAEYGSYVKVGYLKSQNEFLINPIILTKSKTAINCVTDVDGDDIQKHFKSDSILVKYIDGFQKTKQTTFTRQDSCLVQSIIENM